jgi:hypothetical protein
VRSPERRRFRGDGGAVIVEAAFVMPILLALVLGLMDFSLWEFQESQASSAARDGARAGVVLSLDAADQASTKQAITDAVRGKIPDPDKLQGFTVQVWCAGGTPGTDFSGCSPAEPGQTRLVVEASWTYEPVSFVGDTFGTPTVSSTAEMVWTGPRRAGGSPTPPDLCELNGTPTVVTKPNLSANPGTLQSPGYVEVRFPLNSTSFCGTQSATFTDSDGDSAGTASVTSFSGSVATVRAQTPSAIPSGSYTIELTAGGRAFSQTVSLDAAVPTICTVTVTAATPLQRQGNGGNLQTDVTGTVALSNCSGTWTVALIRSNGSVTYQTLTTTQSESFDVTFSGQRNSNNGNEPYVVGTYRIEVTGGDLSGTAVSNDIVVN